MGVDTLAGWLWAAWTDTTAANIDAGALNSAGVGYSIAERRSGVAGLPRDIHVPSAGWPAARRTWSRVRADAGSRRAGDGGEPVPRSTRRTGSTSTVTRVWLGTEEIRYLDADISVIVHHETDDSTDPFRS